MGLILPSDRLPCPLASLGFSSPINLKLLGFLWVDLPFDGCPAGLLQIISRAVATDAGLFPTLLPPARPGVSRMRCFAPVRGHTGAGDLYVRLSKSIGGTSAMAISTKTACRIHTKRACLFCGRQALTFLLYQVVKGQAACTGWFRLCFQWDRAF